MRNNQLVGLPTSIQRLTQLEELDLSGNKLTELRSEISDLRELSVMRNPLTVHAVLKTCLKVKEERGTCTWCCRLAQRIL